jgi:hypothetical protein
VNTLPTFQALALYAREHFGEDGYPFKESIPSSFDLVLGVYLDPMDEGRDEPVRARASTVVQEHLCSRAGFSPVTQTAVDDFVRDALAYLRGQFTSTEDARRHQRTLSHLFWGNLVEARAVFGPLCLTACSCGYVMAGRNEDDLYGLVRRHLWGQTEPERHRPIELPETVLRRHLVGDQDLGHQSVVFESLLQPEAARR